MARNWTAEQKNAIDSRRGSILVSAAAGSGKTAVLVERVIERLTDGESGGSADRLLIVTFTKAAAAEMRGRILSALEEEIKKNPSDERLAAQKMLLPSAKICTIDSFCSSLVREHFEELDISPDFQIADDGELALLSQKAMELTMEEQYLKNERSFTDLVELLFKGRDDAFLSEMILEMYKHSMSYPFPESWLDGIGAQYENGDSVSNSVFGKVILDYARSAVSYCRETLFAMKRTVCGCEGLEKAFLPAIESDEAQIRYIEECLEENDWDKICRAIFAFEMKRRGNTPKEYADSPEITFLCTSRDRIKDIIKTNLPKLFCSSEEEFKDDMHFFAPMVKSLCSCVKSYASHFSMLKKEKQLADFNDVTHYALQLLVRETVDGFEITELARELKKNFDEILIDEYQDTNKAQDMIFEALGNGNLFRVGDVKQSIYRFRQAMPEIFISLKNALPLYEREKEKYPAKIVLKNNFRSRRSVTDAVNFVFSQLMSEKMGGVDYGEEEELVFSAPYGEKNDECAEFHILETGGIDKTESDAKLVFQARYVASLVEKLVKSGYTVKGENGGERPVQYKDICILMRAVGGKKGITYASALRERGIPCFTQIDAEFFTANEVRLLLNVLRVVDNPEQDIPLLSVMVSVLFGFTPDECADLRINCRGKSIYSCLLSARERKDEKSAAMLEKIERWRRIGVCMSVGDFVRMIYDETGIYSVVRSVKGSGAKRENLMLLLDYADIYEKAGYASFSGFIRFIDRLEKTKGDLPGAVGVSSEADVVKIMTIHKSKGLEFPVCIVAGCSSRFNRSDEIKNAVISPLHGLGLIRRDADTMAQYATVCHRAVAKALRDDTVSEEMRVLYVAMTRAKEKLIMVAAEDNAVKKALKCSSLIDPASEKLTAFACSLAASYTDWLLAAFLRHEGAERLREEAGIGENIVLPKKNPFKLVVADGFDEVYTKKETENAEADPALLFELEKRLSWQYPYEELSYVVSKRAASEVDKNAVDREYFASSRPAFLSGGKLTGAQRGIATHAFMQFADYKNAADDLENEINAVFERGLLTKEQCDCISRRQLEHFFESKLARRILESPLVMREKKFTVSVPIAEVYPSLSRFEDEKVMIQGIADCVFLEDGKLVVLDYKTDRLDSENEFREKYSSQVRTYKKALALCTGYEVSKTLLYSFHLGKEIAVE